MPRREESLPERPSAPPALRRGNDRNRTVVHGRDEQLESSSDVLELDDALAPAGDSRTPGFFDQRDPRDEARRDAPGGARYRGNERATPRHAYSVALTMSEIALTRSGSSVSGPTRAARHACAGGIPPAMRRPVATSSLVLGASASP